MFSNINSKYHVCIAQKELEKPVKPVMSHIFASNAIAAGAFNLVPEIDVEAISDKLLSSVTEAVILLTSSSSARKINKWWTISSTTIIKNQLESSISWNQSVETG